MPNRVIELHPSNWHELRGLRHSEIATWATRMLWARSAPLRPISDPIAREMYR
jgi:hypothetical protein